MMKSLLFLFCVAAVYAQNWTWAGFRLYGDAGCTGTMTYTSIRLNVCWDNEFNETYPFTIATCTGSSYVQKVCADAACSKCVEWSNSTLNKCEDDDGSSFTQCFDEQPSFPLATSEGFFYSSHDCSGTPVAASYGSFQVGCLPGGMKVECVDGGASMMRCSDAECTQNCSLVLSEPAGCFSTPTGSQSYKCYSD